MLSEVEAIEVLAGPKVMRQQLQDLETPPWTLTLAIGGAIAAAIAAGVIYLVVTPPPPPPPPSGGTVAIGQTVASGPAPLTVYFTATPSGGVAPYSYHWDFGDGGTSTAQDPMHVFENPGVYTIKLTATDANGDVLQTAPATVTVSAPSQPPTPHGPTLTVNGSQTSVSVAQNGPLNWKASGATPGARVELGLTASADPTSGRYVADAATADANGNASGIYQLQAGPMVYGGAILYATAYDTAIGTEAGYSQPVEITVKSITIM